MASTVRLSDADIAIAKEAAELNNRSTAAQISHWMKIGRIIESSPSYDAGKVEAAMRAEIAYDDLSAEEQDVFLEKFHDQMREFSAEDEAAFLAEISARQDDDPGGIFSHDLLNKLAEAIQDPKSEDGIAVNTLAQEIIDGGLINKQGEQGFTLLMLSLIHI